MTAPVILVDASPRRANDGAVQTVRLAGGGALYPYRYGGADYRAGIVQLPDFVESLPFEGGDFGAGGVPQAAEIQWAPSTKADLAAMANYFWIDAAITVRIGDENAAGTLPAVAITGKALAATVDGGVLKISLCDPAADLKKPLLTARYGGTGNLDGPAEWDGKIKRRVWGRVWNLAGELIDPANNIYCWADPAQRLQGFDAVRDKGAPAATLTTVAWQGSQAATLAALRAAAAPQGGGVTCPSIGCVKWWTQPAGELTADLRGEIGAGYVETTAEIVQRIVQAGPNTPFASGTIAAASGWRPAPVGWVAKDENTTVAAMIEELLGHSSLLWLLDASGSIVLRQWAWGASAASGRSQSVKRTDVLRPVSTRKIGYARNETPTARGNLAAIVLANDATYLDGTPLENLKPAQAGSDKTSVNTAAAISGQGPLATVPSAAPYTNTNVPVAGANRVPFSLFEAGMGGWSIGYNSASLPVSLSFGTGQGLAYLKPNVTTTAVGQVLSLKSSSFPVTAGETLAVSCRYESIGWSVYTAILFFNAAGSLISNTPVLSAPAGTSYGTYRSGTVVVPAGAVTAWMETYFTSTAVGGSGTYPATIQQPFVCGVQDGQASVPAFVPGPNAYNAADVTGSNTAAAITGQAATATNSDYGAITGTKPPSNADKTSLNIAAGIAGQGTGATASTLAGLDPSAAATLAAASAANSRIAPSGTTFSIKVAAGASVALNGIISLAAGGTNGNVKVLLQAAVSGSGSFSTFATGPGSFVGATEPGSDETTGTFTNSTGVTQVFDFRVSALRTPGTAGGAVIASQSFIST